MKPALPIKRVDTLDAFIAAAAKDKAHPVPVVYRLKSHELFPCHEKWTDEFLESIDVPVGIHRATKPSFFDFRHSPVELARSAIRHEVLVSELVRSRRDPKVYWEMISGTDTHLLLENGPVPRWSKLWEDAKSIVNILPSKLYRVGFWISCGRKNSLDSLSSQMHWDVNGHHNFNFQVRGEKSVILFDPNDSPYLYRMPARLWHLSRIDPRDPDLEQYPLLKCTQPHEVTLEEGDILFIPSAWWHHVTHRGELNVNLTFWFFSEKDSGKIWTWESLIVPKPIEAWFYVAKLLAALLVVLPPMLVYERVCTALQQSASTKQIYLWLVSTLILPVLGVAIIYAIPNLKEPA